MEQNRISGLQSVHQQIKTNSQDKSYIKENMFKSVDKMFNYVDKNEFER